jgi:outer membrane receptor protein involved in Fe transport
MIRSVLPVHPSPPPDDATPHPAPPAFCRDDRRRAPAADGVRRGAAAHAAGSPRAVERAGLTLAGGALSTTFLASHVGRAFGDANNTARSEDAVVGEIPAYTVLDWSASARVGHGALRAWRLQAGVNNVADRHYFTRRTDEYPGPGIIPAVGRSVYVSLRAAP